MQSLVIGFGVVFALFVLILLVGAFCAIKWPYRGQGWIHTTSRSYKMTHAQTAEANRLMQHTPMSRWPRDLRMFYQREVLRLGSMSGDGIWEIVVKYVKTMSPFATEERTFDNPHPFVPPEAGESIVYRDAPYFDDSAIRRYAQKGDRK